MNKTAQTELHRLFLIEGLPEPLTAASRHLQIFDNYIAQTRLRLRKVRDPYANSWTRILQQRFAAEDGEYARVRLAEIYLNDDEYGVFAQHEGREIRKNRYFHEFDGVSVSFDVYLGPLQGLTTAKIEFETLERLQQFDPPAFAVFEITNDPFFEGRELVERSFADIQAEVLRLGSIIPTAPEIADE